MSNTETKNATGAGGGVGIAGLLGVAFVVLKLTGIIAWSWLWVLAPFWIPVALFIIIMLIVFVVTFVAVLK